MTQALIVANGLVFLAMVLTGVSFLNPSGVDLLKWGADYGALTLAGQWWRVFTSMFVHVGVLHVALNMWCLWDLGNLGEKLFGRTSFLLLYVLSGLGGSVVSLRWNPEIVSAGASGAVFGVAGGLVAALYGRRLPMPAAATQKKLSSVTTFILYNVFYGMTRLGIDNAAHLGGLAFGAALGYLLPLLAPTADEQEPQQHKAAAVAFMTALAVAGLFWSARSANSAVVEVDEARALIESNQLDPAIAMLRKITKQKPNMAVAHSLLGYALMEKKEDDAALQAFGRSIELRPDDAFAHLNLGVVYLRKQQFDQAIQSSAKAAQLNPSLWQAHFNLGLSYHAKGEFLKAIPVFKQALSLQPNDPAIHQFLGSAYLEAGQTDQGIASLKRAIELKPDDPAFYGEIAEAYRKKGMKKETADARTRQADLLKNQAAVPH